jgi:hypothetical protein
MLMDSFENAEADRGALPIEARNEAENVIHATEKRSAPRYRPDREGRARVRRAEEDRVGAAGLKMVLNSSDRETIQKWTQALNDATALAEVMMNRLSRPRCPART